jgi:hypothetical protein
MDAANAALKAASNTASTAAANFANVTATAYEDVKRTTTPEFLEAESKATRGRIWENVAKTTDASYLLTGLSKAAGSLLR